MKKQLSLVPVLAMVLGLAACSPTVRVETPDKPITINLNIKHEILVKVDKELESVLSDESGLF